MGASGLFAITLDTIIGRNRYHVAAGTPCRDVSDGRSREF